MAQLVRDNSLQLVARNGVEQPARHRNGSVLGIATGGKCVGIGIGNDVDRGLGSPAAMLISSTTLSSWRSFSASSSDAPDRQRTVDRNGSGGQQHRSIAGVVAGKSRDTANAERRERADGKHELAAADVEAIESVSEKQQKGDEHGHDQPTYAGGSRPAARRDCRPDLLPHREVDSRHLTLGGIGDLE